MILIIDNYDSFVYNLARYVNELGFLSHVLRNDGISIEDIIQLNPEKIMISPGPGFPSTAGISLNVIRHFGEKIPILGICLGHQAIGQVYGGKIVHAKKPMHGKTSFITHHGQDIFKNISNPLKVGRYHSLIVDQESLPDNLQVIAQSAEGEIMGLKHRHYPVFGLQFHPESIMTEEGYALLNNFCSYALPAVENLS